MVMGFMPFIHRNLEDIVGDMADKFNRPCKSLHAVSVTRPGFKPTLADASALKTTA